MILTVRSQCRQIKISCCFHIFKCSFSQGVVLQGALQSRGQTLDITQRCVRVCVYKFAYELNSCIYDAAPLLLCREIITTTMRYRCGTSRQAQETRCRQFMLSSTPPQTSSTMPASTSRRTLSVSRQTGRRFLTRPKMAPQPVTTPLLVGLRFPPILLQQSRLSILQSQSLGNHEIDVRVKGEHAVKDLHLSSVHTVHSPRV